MSDGLKEQQSAFVRAIKDPATFQAKNEDEKRRMAIYQSLFFNNVKGFVLSGFPVLTSILSSDDVNHLVRQFFNQHACRSPYFVEISKEFVAYLATEPTLPFSLPNFAAELAHYEWLELDVSIRHASITVSPSTHCKDTDKLFFSPLATLASYTYPVHLIGANFIPAHPSAERNYYLVYRDVQDEVQFTLVNSVTAGMLNTIIQYEDGVALSQLAQLLCEQLPQIPTQNLLNGLHQTVSDLLQKTVLFTKA